MRPLTALVALALCHPSFAGRRATYECAAPVPSVEPITSLTVVAGSKADTPCPRGYTKLPQDLNHGAGGDYVYVCITRGAAPGRFGLPLTGLTATNSYLATNDCPAGSVRISQDCSAGAGGEYVYWCVERWGSKAVTDLTFVSGSETCNATAGYTKLPTNFNVGTLGKPIYACIQQACSVQLTMPEAPRYRADGSFKLTQFTDAHYGEV